RELWNSRQNEGFDGIGNFAKFNTPTIANGKVYVASFSGRLHVFGLLPDNPPPRVSITAPTPRTFVTGPARLTLRAEALSRTGTVTQVEFYGGATALGHVVAPPYTVDWNDVPPGRHTLTAVATDSSGATAVSTPVEITVLDEPVAIGRIISINFV